MKTKAKFPVTAIIAALLSIGGCTYNSDKEKDEFVLQNDGQQAQEKEKMLRDSLEMAFAQTLNEIDQNLDLIREKEGTLILGPESNAEQGITTAEHIKRNISIINSLMEQNKEKLDKLTAQLKKSKSQNTLLTKLTKGAEERIAKQESDIAQLKNELTDKSFELAQLNVKMNDAQLAYAMLEDKANQLDREAYTVYYTVGSYDELKNENVLTREKRALIGKKKALKQDFKKDYFTRIDRREITSIPLFAQKAKLVTFHPKNSFALKEDKDQVTYLEIKDPDEFWKASKVLVVEVKI